MHSAVTLPPRRVNTSECTRATVYTVLPGRRTVHTLRRQTPGKKPVFAAYRIGRQGRKVLGHGGVVFESFQKPCFRGFGVGHGLLRGKRLGGDEEEGRFCIDLFQNLCDVCSVDVGAEVRRNAARVGLERFRHHQRAKI